MDESMKLAEMGKLICERNIRCRLESQGIPPMESNKDVKEKDKKLQSLLNEMIDMRRMQRSNQNLPTEPN